jgi:hypothetical protein
MSETKTRTCKPCGCTLPLTAEHFPTKKHGEFGYYCRSCQSKAVMASSKRNITAAKELVIESQRGVDPCECRCTTCMEVFPETKKYFWTTPSGKLTYTCRKCHSLLSGIPFAQESTAVEPVCPFEFLAHPGDSEPCQRWGVWVVEENTDQLRWVAIDGYPSHLKPNPAGYQMDENDPDSYKKTLLG